MGYGAKATFGSDLVVSTTPNIFSALAAMLDRKGYPNKSITVKEEISMLTINGAWCMSMKRVVLKKASPPILWYWIATGLKVTAVSV